MVGRWFALRPKVDLCVNDHHGDCFLLYRGNVSR
jgi:hypothetical protein